MGLVYRQVRAARVKPAAQVMALGKVIDCSAAGRRRNPHAGATDVSGGVGCTAAAVAVALLSVSSCVSECVCVCMHACMRGVSVSAHASACGPASACHIRFSYSRRAQRCSSSRTRAFSAANTLSLLAAADTASSAILDKLCVCVCVRARACIYARTDAHAHKHTYTWPPQRPWTSSASCQLPSPS